MSRQIDNKVVSMEFDNRSFERHVEQSIGTLDRLKKSLDFSGEEKSLDSYSKKVSKFNLNPLTAAASAAEKGFSKLEMVALTTISRITNEAITMGENLIKSVSGIEMVKQGWEKYNEKASSVQTIMSATRDQFEDEGEQMEYVNAQLERLNWFTDETSYSYLDMASNIGKFTNAGVELDKAVESMIGIATWAGLSGANVQQASHAMYNLSQSMGMGKVQLIDWKSIENANMHTQEFKQTVIDTAVELGTLRKEGEKAFVDVYNDKGEFLRSEEVNPNTLRDTLAHDWFTSDVLTKTLSTFGGFANKVYDVINDFNENAAADAEVSTIELLQLVKDYKKDLTDNGGKLSSDMQSRLAEMATRLNMSLRPLKQTIRELASEEYDIGLRAFLASQETKTFQEALDYTRDAASTGWMNTFETIIGDFLQAKKIWTQLSEDLYDIFIAPIDERNAALEEWSKQGGRSLLMLGVTDAWNGILNIIMAVREALQDIFPKKTAQDFINITAKFQSVMHRFKLWTDDLESFKSVIRGILSVFGILKEALSAVGYIIKEVIGYIFSFREGTNNAAASIGDWLTNLYKTIKEQKTFMKVAESVIDVFKTIIDFLRKIPEYVDQAFQSLTGMTIGEAFEKLSNFLTPIFNNILKFFKSFKEVDMTGATTFGERLKRIFSALKPLFDGLLKTLKDLSPFFTKLFGMVGDGLLNMSERFAEVISAGNISKIFDVLADGIETGFGLILLKFINSILKVVKNSGEVVGAFADILSGVANVLNSFSKQVKANSFKTIASAILMLAAAMLILALIDPDTLASVLIVVIALFHELESAITRFGKIKSVSIGIAAALIPFAVAILILVVAMKKLSDIPTDDIISGLLALSGVMLILARAFNILGKSATPSTFSFLEDGTVFKKTNNKIASTIIALGVALLALAVAMLIISKIPEDGLIRAGIALGSFIAALVIAIRIMKGADVTGIFGFAAGLFLLTFSLKRLDSMGTGSLLKTIGALAAMAIAMGIAIRIMGDTKAEGSVKTIKALSSAILRMSIAIFVMVGAISLLGLVFKDVAPEKRAKILTGILTTAILGVIVILFALVGAVMALSKINTKALDRVATVLLKLSLVIMAIGVGVALLSAGLVILAMNAAILEGIGALVGHVLVDTLMTIIEAIPMFIAAFQAGLIKSRAILKEALIEGFMIIYDALVAAVHKIANGNLSALMDDLILIIVEACRLVKDTAWPLAEALCEVFLAVLVELANYIEPIVKALMDILVGIVRGIADDLGPLAKAGYLRLLAVFLA